VKVSKNSFATFW